LARTGPWQLALCRFSSGIAIGAAVPPIFALAEELIHPRQRRHRSSMAATPGATPGPPMSTNVHQCPPMSTNVHQCPPSPLGFWAVLGCFGLIKIVHLVSVTDTIPCTFGALTMALMG